MENEREYYLLNNLGKMWFIKCRNETAFTLFKKCNIQNYLELLSRYREYIINAGTYKKIVVVDPRHLILFGN